MRLDVAKYYEQSGSNAVFRFDRYAIDCRQTLGIEKIESEYFFENVASVLPDTSRVEQLEWHLASGIDFIIITEAIRERVWLNLKIWKIVGMESYLTSFYVPKISFSSDSFFASDLDLRNFLVYGEDLYGRDGCL